MHVPSGFCAFAFPVSTRLASLLHLKAKPTARPLRSLLCSGQSGACLLRVLVTLCICTAEPEGDSLDLGAGLSALSPSPATDQLCDLDPVASPLCLSFLTCKMRVKIAPPHGNV